MWSVECVQNPKRPEVLYVHVFPDFGREHVRRDGDCWCDPQGKLYDGDLDGDVTAEVGQRVGILIKHKVLH